MKRLIAPFVLFVAAGSALASPFVLEELVRELDALPGLDGSVISITSPSINSSGEWALAVGSQVGGLLTFQNGVLGNDGFRIEPGFDPDGAKSEFVLRYGAVTIRDNGELVVAGGRQTPGGAAEIWLGDQLASGLPSQAYRQVTVLPNRTLIGSSLGSSIVAQLGSDGEWTWITSQAPGLNIPVGTLLSTPSTTRGYARSPSGREAWTGRIRPSGETGPGTWSVVADDAFVAIDGQPSAIAGYSYRIGAGGIALQADGDLFFSAGLEWMGEGPTQSIGGIFRESGAPLVTSRDDIAGLDSLGEWTVSPGGFEIDESDNLLWVAQSTMFPCPDDPFGVVRGALMYNHTVLAATGDVLADGSIVLSPSGKRSMSADGNWIIASLLVRDPVLGNVDAVYRIAVPTPGVLSLGVIAGFAATRRRRAQLAG